MKKGIWLAICLMAVCFFAPPSKTYTQTVHPKLDSALQHTLDSMFLVLNIKGLGAAVQLPDDAVWTGSDGISSMIPLDSITPNHAFAIASTTKTITAACILQLADEGVLSLSDSLYQWLDTFPHINPNITIRQLLQHKSGIYDVVTNPAFQPQMQTNINQIWSLDNVITTFIHPPLFQPGNGWSYSNTNYILLGMIIEAATGHTYRQELRDRFFIPYELNSFAHPPFDPLPTQIAHLWLDITGDGVLDDAHNFFSHWNSFFSATGPAGAYFATPTDMARWMRICMSGALYSPAIWQEATTTVTTSFQGGTRYGLGLMQRFFNGHKGYGHGGDISYSSSVFYFPDKDISIAVHANDGSINSWSLAPVVAALLKTYLDCEAQITDAKAIEKPVATWTVYPNPFHDQLHISGSVPTSAKEVTWTLVNNYGDKITDLHPVSQPSEVLTISQDNLGQLPQGVYYLLLFVDGKNAGVQKVYKIDN